MEQILAGVRVVEVAQWWFVPAAGAVLADWGADVLKVEHPTSGDPQRGLMTSGLVPNTGGVNFMVEQPNRGKRSIGIDLNQPEGLEVLHRLVETADVFLTNFLPAARRRLKIELEDIRQVNPKIIYVRGHGQGARGPEMEKGGYDAASFWCRGGICSALTPAGAAAPIDAAGRLRRLDRRPGPGRRHRRRPLPPRAHAASRRWSTCRCSAPPCGSWRPTSSPPSC